MPTGQWGPLLFYFYSVHLSESVFQYVHVRAGVLDGWKKVLDPPELELCEVNIHLL